MAFIGQRSGEPLKWRHISVFHEISKDTISKIKYTALFQNLMKPSLKSSSTIYDYVNLQELDDFCQISVGQNIIWLKSCFPGGGGGGGGLSEINVLYLKKKMTILMTILMIFFFRK